ncbi:hypothetical protein pb186bvf_018338 [Paramecium bursaria]
MGKILFTVIVNSLLDTLSTTPSTNTMYNNFHGPSIDKFYYLYSQIISEYYHIIINLDFRIYLFTFQVTRRIINTNYYHKINQSILRLSLLQEILILQETQSLKKINNCQQQLMKISRTYLINENKN